MEDVWQVHLLLQAGPLLLVPDVFDWLHCLLDWAWPSLCQWNCSWQRNCGRELCSLHLVDKGRAYCDTGASIDAYSFWGRILVTDCLKQYQYFKVSKSKLINRMVIKDSSPPPSHASSCNFIILLASSLWSQIVELKFVSVMVNGTLRAWNLRKLGFLFYLSSV